MSTELQKMKKNPRFIYYSINNTRKDRILRETGLYKCQDKQSPDACILTGLVSIHIRILQHPTKVTSIFLRLSTNGSGVEGDCHRPHGLIVKHFCDEAFESRHIILTRIPYHLQINTKVLMN
jgi:hypothetical protein